MTSSRRTLLAAACAILLIAPAAGEAQQTTKVWRIGWLRITEAPADVSVLEAFRRGLRDQGLVEGQHFVIEFRHAAGRADRLPAATSGLLRLNVDVIVATGTQPALATRAATSTVPIVAVMSDAVGAGLVKSLARPDGNVTGLSLITPELAGKRLALLCQHSTVCRPCA